MGATVHPELSDEMTTLDTATAGEPPKDRVVFKALNAAQVGAATRAPAPHHHSDSQ